jgi:TolB protein
MERRRRLAIAVAVAAMLVSFLPASSSASVSPSASAPSAAALGTPHRIAFSSDRAGGSEIFTADETGGDVRQITHVGPNAVAFQPTWSPDGSTLAYTRFPLDDSNPSIRLVDADGGNDRRLFRDALFSDFEPEFSPDGSTILFTRCRPPFGPCTLYTIRVDGSHLHQVVPFTVDGSDQQGDYASDGTRIAYAEFYNRAGLAAVYVAGADGSDPDRITRWALQAFLPTWAPDGGSIVYSSHCCDGRPGSLWISNPDGSDRRRLTDPGRRFDGASTFSPSGDLIAFERYAPDFSTGDVWVVAPDGTGLRTLIPHAIEPAWSS